MEFPLATFRLLYPQFAMVSDEVVLAVAQQALCYTAERACSCTESMWLLMVAHLLQLAANASAGGGAGAQLASASIDKVSVSFSVPPATDSWSYWLNGTPYGQQFAALLKRCASGGAYVGGSRERAAFRIVGGRFPSGRRF